MSEAIDLKEVLERVQDDKELLLELFDIFQDDFLKKRQLLGEAVAAKQITQIKELAHSIKGSSGNISAKSLHAACLKLEHLAKSNDVNSMNEVLTDIDAQFAQVKIFTANIKKEWSG